MSQRETDRQYSCSQAPCKVIQTSDKHQKVTNYWVPLLSDHLTHFKPVTAWEVAGEAKPRHLLYLYVRAPKPCSVTENHPLPPASRNQKGPGVDWTPYDRISFWALLSKSRQPQKCFRIPHAKTWLIYISLCMWLLLPAVMVSIGDVTKSRWPLEQTGWQHTDLHSKYGLNGVTVCCCYGHILKWELKLTLKRKPFMAQSYYIETILLWNNSRLQYSRCWINTSHCLSDLSMCFFLSRFLSFRNFLGYRESIAF